jgi:hypothetical protein
VISFKTSVTLAAATTSKPLFSSVRVIMVRMTSSSSTSGPGAKLMFRLGSQQRYSNCQQCYSGVSG